MRPVVLVLLVALPMTFGQDNYCYKGTCGPQTWTGTCRTGKVQSPISIIPSSATKAKPGRTLIFSADYYAVNDFSIRNTGRTVTVTQTAAGDGSLQVKGAGWNGTYTFVEMTFHWGSEHLIKGQRFPLELQIRHQQAGGGSAQGIIGVIFAVTKSDNKALDPIIAAIPEILDVGVTPLKMEKGLNLTALFPPVWDVFRYLGSLTVPPCTEGVLWSVFTQRMPISKAQVDAFATVLDNTMEKLTRNYRPTSQAITSSRKKIFWMQINKAKMLGLAF